MSTMALRTQAPWSVWMGFKPISTGNSLPSFRKPHRSRPAPIARARGSCMNAARFAGCAPRYLSGTRLSTPAPVPEKLLRLVVDPNDFSPRIGQDHGVRGRFHNPPEYFFGPLALGDIDDDAEHPDPFVGLYGV